MDDKIKKNNITLVLAVVILGLIIAGMVVGREDDETFRNGVTPYSITSRKMRQYNRDSLKKGNVYRQLPFTLAGGTSPSINNTQVNTPVQQRIPSEGVWMGMEIEGLSPGTIRELGLPKNQTGVIVDSVPPGSDAEKAGLINGDIIRSINGQYIVNMADYIKATKNQKITSAIIGIERSGQIISIAIPPGSTVRTGMAGIWPGVNSTGSNVDAYTKASPKFTRIINKNGIPPIMMNAPLPHAYVGVCAKCHEIVQGRIPLNLLNVPANSPAGTTYQGNYSLPSPAQQNAAHKVLVEGHWLGMELIPITPELAREYKLPHGVTGLLVDEVTLEAAESGLLAGDVLQSINNIPVETLEDFGQATRRVAYMPSVTLGAVRNGKPVTLTLQSSWERLGVSQNEAAQPIQPGAISPHKNMGRACTDCHIIMKNGGQLQTDAGDILPVPQPISRNAKAPHSYRGQCNRCHVIIQ